MGMVEFAQHEVLLGKDFLYYSLHQEEKLMSLDLTKLTCFADFFIFLVWRFLPLLLDRLTLFSSKCTKEWSLTLKNISVLRMLFLGKANIKRFSWYNIFQAQYFVLLHLRTEGLQLHKYLFFLEGGNIEAGRRSQTTVLKQKYKHRMKKHHSITVWNDGKAPYLGISSYS